MSKDMYQKQKEGKENSNNTEIDNKTNINWNMPTYRQSYSNHYEIRKAEK